ncbi:MAG: tryptophan synthase subunit alpha [Pseudomonadales bacterium]|nr:tryptophan synthase subunit alpha [Pseudomonadales bacterium]
MSRMAQCFERLANEGRKALIPYIVAGDPVKDITITVMHEMVTKGANIIELGVPFSDPEAEGPVIQLAHERALKHGTSLRDTCQMVAEFRKTDSQTPVVLMGYLNPIEKMGHDTFASLAAASGVDAILIVNLPPEEGEELNQALLDKGIHNICLLAPTTTDARAEYLCNRAHGFIYYVSLKGTTGAATINMQEVKARLDELRHFASIPMVVGFGIKDGETAAAVASFADGSVVGTAVVNLFEVEQHNPEKIIRKVGDLIADMRQAMDSSS